MARIIVVVVGIVAATFDTALVGRNAGASEAQNSPQTSPALATPAPNPDENVAAGDEAWRERGTRAKLDQAIVAWKQAVTDNPQDAATWAKLSRAHFFLADAHLRKHGKDKSYLDALERGTRAGRKAVWDPLESTCRHASLSIL